MLDLTPIKATLAEATPGPWYGDDGDILSGNEEALYHFVFVSNSEDGSAFPNPADKRLFKRSRQDMEDMVAEIERLRNALGQIAATAEQAYRGAGGPPRTQVNTYRIAALQAIAQQAWAEIGLTAAPTTENR